VHPARRDPRRRPSSRPAPRGHLAGTGPPREATTARGVARHPGEEPARPANPGELTGRCTRSDGRFLQDSAGAGLVRWPHEEDSRL
jgi:hypothetical protein